MTAGDDATTVAMRVGSGSLQWPRPGGPFSEGVVRRSGLARVSPYCWRAAVRRRLWAFTFPLGANTVATFQLARTWHTSGLERAGAALFLLLAVFWLLVSTRAPSRDTHGEGVAAMSARITIPPHTAAAPRCSA